MKQRRASLAYTDRGLSRIIFDGNKAEAEWTRFDLGVFATECLEKYRTLILSTPLPPVPGVTNSTDSGKWYLSTYSSDFDTYFVDYNFIPKGPYITYSMLINKNPIRPEGDSASAIVTYQVDCKLKRQAQITFTEYKEFMGKGDINRVETGDGEAWENFQDLEMGADGWTVCDKPIDFAAWACLETNSYWKRNQKWVPAVINSRENKLMRWQQTETLLERFSREYNMEEVIRIFQKTVEAFEDETEDKE
jgi:hypothetical protein